jgi:TPR repeat protein
MTPYTTFRGAELKQIAVLALFALSLAEATSAGEERAATYSVTEQRHYIAFSLKAAESRIRQAFNDQSDFRRDRELYGLGGMTKPKAIFFDAVTKDWILLGERSTEAGELTLDDLTVALRTRYRYPDTDPGVTIEPTVSGEKDVMDKPKDWGHAKSLRVVFLGSLKDTRFGQTCYEADWLMKRVALGIETLSNVPIPSLLDLVHRDYPHHGSPHIISRFWLCPVLNEIPVLANQKAIFIQESRIMVKTQTLFVERNGQIVQDHTERDAVDTESKKFAKAFTENYDAAAHDRPALERLRGLARLAGIAKGIVVGKWTDDFQFFLQNYQVQPITTPNDVGLLTNMDESLSLSGGVKLRNLAMRLRSGDISALTEAVIKMRPKGNPISWEFLFGDTFLPLPSNNGLKLNSPGALVDGTADETLWWRKAADDGDIGAMLLVAENYFTGASSIQKDISLSMSWFRKAADSGSPSAMFDLAVLYYRGSDGIPKNDPEVLKWLTKAAQAGHGGAMAALGYLYSAGEVGLAKDEVESIRWDREGVKAGNADAMYNLAIHYAYGRGLPKDENESTKWVQKAAEDGQEDAMVFLGNLFNNGEQGLKKNAVEAVEWYRRAANAGSTAGMIWFGGALQNGSGGLEKDEAEGFNWIMKAAKAGHPLAMNNVASAYFLGQGIAKDETEAMRWYRRAAEAGNPLAMHALGVASLDGLHVLPKDEVEAVNWFRKGAAIGDGVSMYDLGRAYHMGLGGLRKDDSEALKWYKKSADADSADGMYSVALAFHDGFGGSKQDDAESLFWMKKAAAKGSPEAMRDLGICYEYGQSGAGIDEVEAVRWYRLASEAGDAVAARNLAVAYHKGLAGLIPREIDEAKWFKKAAELGDSESMYNLGIYCEHGWGGFRRDHSEAIRWMEKARAAGMSQAEQWLNRNR